MSEDLLKGAVSADLDTAACGSNVVTNSVKQAKESSTMSAMRNIFSVPIWSMQHQLWPIRYWTTICKPTRQVARDTTISTT